MIVMQTARVFARFLPKLSKSRVGIGVAPFQGAFSSWVQTFFKVFGQYKKEIRHAVDNSGDSVGLVADWLAFARWWQPHPPAAGRSGGCAGNQSSDRTASCLTGFQYKLTTQAQRHNSI